MMREASVNSSPDPFTRIMELTSSQMKGGPGLNPPTWEMGFFTAPNSKCFMLGLEPGKP